MVKGTGLVTVTENKLQMSRDAPELVCIKILKDWLHQDTQKPESLLDLVPIIFGLIQLKLNTNNSNTIIMI